MYEAPIQIICHNYGSIAEVLNTFDIQCCKCAFTGTEVLMTEDALVSHATKTIILDLPRSKFTYEHRISKYMYRGYGLILKNLDTQKVWDTPTNKYGDRKISLSRLDLVGIDDYGANDGLGNVIRVRHFDANYKIPENSYGSNITIPIISARDKHIIVEPFKISESVFKYERILKIAEAKSIIRPLQYYYDLFVLDHAHLTDTADNLGLSKEEFQTFKNTANIEGIPLIGLLKRLVDEKLPRIEQVYNDCLARLVVCDNIIWDVTNCNIKIPTAEEWYGAYYK
jgi:hypothetical protein